MQQAVCSVIGQVLLQINSQASPAWDRAGKAHAWHGPRHPSMIHPSTNADLAGFAFQFSIANDHLGCYHHY